MEAVTIQRRGSLLYSRAYYGLVVALTLAYALLGGLMAVAAAATFERVLIGALVFALVICVIVLMWAVYLSVLWVFTRESRQSVEITDEGIREMRGGREHAFIPWNGVKEIELAATIVAGASLRLKSNFSEISISNVDLAITHAMSLREMHRSLGQTGRLRRLLVDLRANAPQAPLRMNSLARRRLKKYAWAESG